MKVRIAIFTILTFVLAVGLLLADEWEDQLAEMLKRFPEADADGDGTLTIDEAVAFRENRLAEEDRQRPDQTRFATPEMLQVYDARTFDGVPYRLMKPFDLADNPDKAYPLILSLHGGGGRGKDNKKNLRPWNVAMAEESLRRKHPCFVVVPQTEVPWTVPGSMPELTDEEVAAYPEVWQNWLERRRSRTRDDVEGELDKVFKLLDGLCQEFNIDQARVYVLGHSMGGSGTWTAIYEQPERFAAAIPTAGGFPPWRDANRIVDVPIWGFHGDQDPVVPVEFTRSVFEQLKLVGGNMKYTELKGVKHNASSTAFVYTGDDTERGFVTQYTNDRCDRTPDVWDWLFAQRKQQLPAAGFQLFDL